MKYVRLLILLISIFFFSSSAKSQVFVGSYTGTELLGAIGGYKFANKLSIGLKFSPPNNFGNVSRGVAGYLGPYTKYDFIDLTLPDGYFSCQFYVVASAGIITPPPSSYYVNLPSLSVTNINYKSTFGGLVGLGAAIGKKSKLFVESGFGKMPDTDIAINSTDPYSNSTQTANTSKAFTGNFYIAGGVFFQIFKEN